MLGFIGLVVLWQLISAKEYCQFDHFNATCVRRAGKRAGSSVVLLTEARYGRFRLDTCISQSYGHMGCEANVLDLLDRDCSGRPHCSFNIASLRKLVQPCPKDLTSHLEASYVCLPVVSQPSYKCNSTIWLNDQTSSIHVAHNLTMRGGPGSESCPITVRAQSGQRLNLSVYNFQPNLQASSDLCPYYAVLSERGRLNSTRLCNTRHRHQHLMTSNTSVVTFYYYMVDQRSQLSPGFIVKIEASGCPDVRPPRGAWVERTDEKAVVRCNHSQETWYLTCRDNQWIGAVTNCSMHTVPSNGGQVDERSTTLPFGLMVAITIGVVLGIIFGIGMLIAVFVFRKSRRRQRTPPKVNTLLGEERDGSQLDSDDTYARRMWHECGTGPVPLNSGTAGIYGRGACHSHPVNQHICAGDYTQMLELKCANTPPSARECVYGSSRQVKFIEPAHPPLITYPTYKSSETVYDSHSIARQPPAPPPPVCDHYSMNASDSDLLTPDKQPDVVQTNGVSKDPEPTDNIRNLQQWLEDHSTKRQDSTSSVRSSRDFS